MRSMSRTLRGCLMGVFAMACCVAAGAGVGVAGLPVEEDFDYSVLHYFGNGTDGHHGPKHLTAPLLIARDGQLYGVSARGGTGSSIYGGGSVFRMSPEGQITVLHRFGKGSSSDGYYPSGGLIQASDGTFYGVTSLGGAPHFEGSGTVYRMNADGLVAVLHTFKGWPTDGAEPAGELMEHTDGNFYGTTRRGGRSGIDHQLGTIFRMRPNGDLTVLHSFTGATGASDSDGAYPNGGLVAAADGHLYGTTSDGGIYDGGTVFRMDMDGQVEIVHHFGSPLGEHSGGYYPLAPLTRTRDGQLYGVTQYGGDKRHTGVVFFLDDHQRAQTLHSLRAIEGAQPQSRILEADDGFLYFTTARGGPHDRGTVVSMARDGKTHVVHAFTADQDGSVPLAGLVQDAGRSLYGTTYWSHPPGGLAAKHGAIFRLTPKP
jgi:uncharacterized repeat protein (TIGR03803 family)